MKKTNIYESKDNRILTDDQAKGVINKVISFLHKGTELHVSLNSLWYGNQRWARNRAFETNNIQKVQLSISVLHGYPGDRYVRIDLNQFDDTSLKDACRFINREMDHQYTTGKFHRGLDLKLDSPTWESKGIPVWSDSTFKRTAVENSDLITAITGRAEAEGILCAGTIDTSGAQFMGYKRDPWGQEEWERGVATMAECSTTVRHPKGVGSGWAGASSFDMKRLDLTKLGEIAFDKCMRSINPVRIEPGRYQTILEPQATASFATEFANLFQSRIRPEGGGNPLFHEYDSQIERGRSRLGLRVADRRLSISHDPEDPVIGTHPYKSMQKVDFLKDGVVTVLGREFKDYSLPQMSAGDQVLRRWSFQMTSAETISVDEMISGTKRGLLLTRVSDMHLIDEPSALYTGLTRDGLWLIENGKITKAVRNFRWTESPVFVFNNVESIGESVPVMRSWHQTFPFLHGELQLTVPSVVVPTIKINDFSFTSTVDAI